MTVSGMRSEGHLNGYQGTLLRYLEDKSRWEVQFTTGEVKAVRAICLTGAAGKSTANGDGRAQDGGKESRHDGKRKHKRKGVAEASAPTGSAADAANSAQGDPNVSDMLSRFAALVGKPAPATTPTPAATAAPTAGAAAAGTLRSKRKKHHSVRPVPAAPAAEDQDSRECEGSRVSRKKERKAGGASRGGRSGSLRNHAQTQAKERASASASGSRSGRGKQPRAVGLCLRSRSGRRRQGGGQPSGSGRDRGEHRRTDGRRRRTSTGQRGVPVQRSESCSGGISSGQREADRRIKARQKTGALFSTAMGQLTKEKPVGSKSQPPAGEESAAKRSRSSRRDPGNYSEPPERSRSKDRPTQDQLTKDGEAPYPEPVLSSVDKGAVKLDEVSPEKATADGGNANGAAEITASGDADKADTKNGAAEPAQPADEDSSSLSEDAAGDAPASAPVGAPVDAPASEPVAVLTAGSLPDDAPPVSTPEAAPAAAVAAVAPEADVADWDDEESLSPSNADDKALKEAKSSSKTVVSAEATADRAAASAGGDETAVDNAKADAAPEASVSLSEDEPV